MRSFLASAPVAALALPGIAPAAASPPDDTSFTAGATLPLVSAMIAQVGDDSFATMDVTSLLASSSASPTQHYGPFPSGSPDSGTCGNDWAQDSFDRHFTVRANSPTSFTIVEQFKSGSFVTNLGPSPGACDSSDGTPPATIVAGKTGSLHGYFVITVTGTQMSTDPACQPGSPPAPCTTTGFVTSHFAGPFTIGTFFFHYSAGDQALVFHEWTNASCDRGGNHGDIASALAAPPFTPVSVCP